MTFIVDVAVDVTTHAQTHSDPPACQVRDGGEAWDSVHVNSLHVVGQGDAVGHDAGRGWCFMSHSGHHSAVVEPSVWVRQHGSTFIIAFAA